MDDETIVHLPVLEFINLIVSNPCLLVTFLLIVFIFSGFRRRQSREN